MGPLIVLAQVYVLAIGIVAVVLGFVAVVQKWRKR